MYIVSYNGITQHGNCVYLIISYLMLDTLTGIVNKTDCQYYTYNSANVYN